MLIKLSVYVIAVALLSSADERQSITARFESVREIRTSLSNSFRCGKEVRYNLVQSIVRTIGNTGYPLKINCQSFSDLTN